MKPEEQSALLVIVLHAAPIWAASIRMCCSGGCRWMHALPR